MKTLLTIVLTLALPLWIGPVVLGLILWEVVRGCYFFVYEVVWRVPHPKAPPYSMY